MKPARFLALFRLLPIAATLCASAVAQAANPPQYYLTTLAGVDYAGSVDATGSAARFNLPSSTAVDGSGNIFVADSGNHTIRKVTPAGVVTTLAGLAGIPGSSDGTGSAARFYNPQAVAVDISGNVFVADAGNFTIRKVTPAGVVTTLAGSPGQYGAADGTGSAARFGFNLFADDYSPTALVIDVTGNVYVADGNIRKITPTGVVTTFVTRGTSFAAGSVYNYSGYSVDPSYTLGIDGAGNLYSNEAVNDVQSAIKISPAGTVTGTVGWSLYNGYYATVQSLLLAADHSGSIFAYSGFSQRLYKDGTYFAGFSQSQDQQYTSSLDGPQGTLGQAYGLSVDGADNVNFADQHTHTIRRVSPAGVVSTLAGETDTGGAIDGPGSLARFDAPAGLVVDGSGNVFVADCVSDTIRKIAADGTVTTLAGLDSTAGSSDGSGSNARFSFPQSVALDSSGNLYVADSNNQTIRKISPAGAVTTFAGSAGQPGLTDGTGTAARFANPSGVAVDAADNVFVCDGGNQVIRKISPTGTVSTFVGTVDPANSVRVDGTGTAARFLSPKSVAVDPSGDLFVAEGNNGKGADGALRKITPTGVVTTVHFGADDYAYQANPRVAADSAGNVFIWNNDTTKISAAGSVVNLTAINGIATPQQSFAGSSYFQYNNQNGAGLAVDNQGNLYFGVGSTIRQAVPLAASSASLALTTQPAGATINAGGNLTLSAGATSAQPVTYQWQKDGLNIPGATDPTLSLSGAVPGNNGSYTVLATNSSGSVLSSAASVTVAAAPQATGSIQVLSVNSPTAKTSASGITVTAGDYLTLSLYAIGSPAPNTQVQKNASNLAQGQINGSLQSYLSTGSVHALLSLSSVTISDSGAYDFVFSNPAGSATSSSFTITVLPNITAQPSDLTIPVGSSASFSVTATGSSNLSYQWQKGGTNISGATGTTLNLSNVTASEAGSYTAVVSDTSVPNSVTVSSAATLTLTSTQIAPTITTQPVNLAAYPGSYIPSLDSLNVQATGSPSNFNYQWQKDGVNVPGATGSSFNFTGGVSVNEVGTYTVVVSNPAGSVVSNPANVDLFNAAGAVTITDYLNVTAPPANQVASAGSSVTFTVVAGGKSALTYQWQKGGANLPGATGSMLTLNNIAASDAAVYTVLISESDPTGAQIPNGVAYGATVGRSATLTVSASTGNPSANEIVTSGHNATFSAGNTSGTIQWQVSSDGGINWANLSNDNTYSGTATSTLTLSNAGAAQNGSRYRYLATNSGTVSTSSVVTLTVAPVLLPYPTAITADNAGNLFVADAQTNTIQQVNAAGQISALAGQAGTAGSADGLGSAARFNQPSGLALLPSGTLIIADTANATLRSLSASDMVTTLAGSAGARGNTNGTGATASFSNPLGVAVDQAGNIFVADSMNATIRKITAGGAVTTFAGSPGANGSADGTGSAARFNLPTGLTVDASGNLFVADTNNNTIRKITPAGAVTTFAGLAGVSGSTDGTGANALFNRPSGLAIDGAGNLYLADTGNSTIRRITAVGVVTTLAGLPTIAGLEDGPGTAGALFNQPQALCLDATGNLYVADTGNAALRKIDPSGRVTTLMLSLASTSGSGGNSGGTGSGGNSGGNTGGSGSTGSSPTPTPSGDSSGGGGGSIEAWFALALAGLGLLSRNAARGEPRH